jgi:hypothetical protein
MNIYRYISCAVCIAAISGCSNTSSENVTTAGIAADINVVADGSGRTEVRVFLEVGSGGLGATSLRVGPSDSLTVLANGIQKTMIEHSSIFGQYSYTASYGFDDADTLFVVSFLRDNGVSAPNSSVTLPAGFIVLSPTSIVVYGRNDNISIVWTPNITSIVPKVQVTLTCTQTNGIAITAFQNVALSSDSGIAALPVAAVMPIGELDTGRLCEGRVDLSRLRRGTLDPNYGEGGDITAEQFDRAQFFVDLAI